MTNYWTFEGLEVPQFRIGQSSIINEARKQYDDIKKLLCNLAPRKQSSYFNIRIVLDYIYDNLICQMLFLNVR